jgi:hypothetical protein
MVRESLVGWIFIADSPTNASHLSDAHEVCFPDLVAAKVLFGGFEEARNSFRVASVSAFHVTEVVFMQHHALVLEAQAARKFRIGRHLFLIDLTVCKKLRNLFG